MLALEKGAICALCAGVVVTSMVGCAERAPASSEPAAPPVHAARVSLQPVIPLSTATAEILAARESNLRAETSGRVVALYVEAGDRIEDGQVLLRLDVGRTSSAVQAAQAEVAQSNARFQQAKRELERTEKLVRSGGLAEQRLDDAKDTFRLASAARDAARAEARLARRGLTEAVIRAPFGGTVVERTVEVGEYVAPGNPLLTIADTSLLKARVLLDPREALDVDVGANAFVEAYARPGEEFRGRVVRVGEVIDPRTRRLRVEIELEDTKGRLRPGLVARFSVETGKPEQTVQLPLRAVFERFGRQHVYVIEDGIARRREVRIGPVREGLAEIRDGLRAKELVIVAGVTRVVDGAPVRLVPAERANATHSENETGEAEPADSEAP